jgi:CheY-like chemotaxis protein
MKTDHVLPEVSRLRRYARLLTSDQEAADDLVESVLEHLVDDRLTLSADLPVRTKLYRALHVIRNCEHHGPCHTGLTHIDKRLSALAPVQRTVFLLVAVEQLSLHEAAAVLSLTPSQVAQHLHDAGHAISDQVATSVLILEDEPMIALAIENLALELGHSVAGVATTKREACALLDSSRPGLILADIQLADGTSSIDTLKEVMDRRVPPAIFITAYPERVTAFNQNRIVIPKPFEPDHVKAVISRTLFLQPPDDADRAA